MKAHQLILGAALAALSIAPLGAQSLTPQAGYIASELFRTNPGETVAGLDADNSHLYYLLQRASGSTLLVRRDAADNYATPTVLHDIGALYGSYVRVNSGKLYFGGMSNGAIGTYDLGTSAFAPLATVNGDYDIAFGGGYGWLAANPGFAGNKIIRLDLTTGATTTVLNSTDFSGPVAFDAGGSLYYGATSFGAGGGIYKYSAAELAAGGLALDPAHKWRNNTGNAYFDSDGVSLLQTDFSRLLTYEFSTGSATVVATTSDAMGTIALNGVDAYVTVTNFGGAPATDDRSSVFLVPEPGSMLLGGFGITLLAIRRRRA